MQQRGIRSGEIRRRQAALSWLPGGRVPSGCSLGCSQGLTEGSSDLCTQLYLNFDSTRRASRDDDDAAHRGLGHGVAPALARWPAPVMCNGIGGAARQPLAPTALV